MTPGGALPRRKAPGRGKGWQVEVSPGRWMDEAVAEAQGIPLVYPLTSNGAGPITVRHEAPEVPPVPEVQTPMTPRREPSERQRRAWEAYHRTGGQSAAGRELGWSQGNVRSSLIGYMDALGMVGPVPPPDPSLVPAPSSPSQANGRERRANAFDGPPSEPAAEGATQVLPAAEVAPEPAPDVVVTSGADPVEAAAANESGVTSGPAICNDPPGSLSYVEPRRAGGGGRSEGDGLLARLERELDALAREDAALVAQAREIVEARTDVARRLERLRTAGEVFRALMADRAA